MQKLIIAEKLTTLNEYINAERRNKYISSKIKKQDTSVCEWEARQQLKKIDVPCIFEFTWIESNKRRDPDNIAFAQKFVFDGLIKAGILENDGHKQVKRITHDFEFRNYNGVEIKIIEVM